MESVRSDKEYGRDARQRYGLQSSYTAVSFLELMKMVIKYSIPRWVW